MWGRAPDNLSHAHSLELHLWSMASIRFHKVSRGSLYDPMSQVVTKRELTQQITDFIPMDPIVIV